MFVCAEHPYEATKSILADYAVYSCGGSQRGCGSFAYPASGGGPQNACPDCGKGWTRTSQIQLALGYCNECMPDGYPDDAKPSFIPVRVVGGFVALKPRSV